MAQIKLTKVAKIEPPVAPIDLSSATSLKITPVSGYENEPEQLHYMIPVAHQTTNAASAAWYGAPFTYTPGLSAAYHVAHSGTGAASFSATVDSGAIASYMGAPPTKLLFFHDLADATSTAGIWYRICPWQVGASAVNIPNGMLNTLTAHAWTLIRVNTNNNHVVNISARAVFLPNTQSNPWSIPLKPVGSSTGETGMVYFSW